MSAAHFWFDFGLKVIPIVPLSKSPAGKWKPWEEDSSHQKIAAHWASNPNHELGFITNDDIIVLDADSPASLAALLALEKSFNLTPKLVTQTKKGVHHYFLRTKGTVAKTAGYSTEKHPERIDIKTGRSLVILAPSTGKSIGFCDATSVNDLSPVTQEFIDAVLKHNGQDSTLPLKRAPSKVKSAPQGSLVQLQKLLDTIDPDCGYTDWLQVLMALYHETKGSEEGLDLADSWSSRGGSYMGYKEIKDKWRSFEGNVSNPVTIGTLVKMAQQAGANVKAIMHNDGEDFKICDYEVIEESANAPDQATTLDALGEHPLGRHSLRGHLALVAKQLVDQVFVMDRVALQGQATVFYAAPNTGKTLLALHFLMQSIEQKRVDPSKVYYVNVDDTSRGLHEKLRIAEEYSFHMLTEGYRDFKASGLMSSLSKLTETDQAKGVIVILDTLKKFTDLMDKSISSRFTKIVRAFVLKGGTVVALAHTNKNPGANGKRVQSGTSDIVDDFDCAYLVDAVQQQSDRLKVVEFSNIKRRGDVAIDAAYSYAEEKGLSYEAILMSVQKVDPLQLQTSKHDAQVQSDATYIEAIKACIAEGISTKMMMVQAAAEKVNSSKKSILKVLEHYTGEDSSIHHWKYAVGNRGAQMFVLLQSPPGCPSSPAMPTP
ncbi:MAG: PriCT-2 domain-containing protein [Rhodoferax sp.]|nr:PriCT-2 domain-containing protein [Rhodoferax sp.]